MATYIALVHFTDQGIRNIKQTTERAKALSAAAAKLGVKVKDTYWTMGAYDVVLVAEAPNDEAITALALSVGALGNIRMQTMRAYSAEEMSKIIAKMV
ncbi:GYD domain-containing protein [bacterium]|nr:MAG: GYD domain-containing protein [bacterium]